MIRIICLGSKYCSLLLPWIKMYYFRNLTQFKILFPLNFSLDKRTELEWHVYYSMKLLLNQASVMYCFAENQNVVTRHCCLLSGCSVSVPLSFYHESESSFYVVKLESKYCSLVFLPRIKMQCLCGKSQIKILSPCTFTYGQKTVFM